MSASLNVVVLVGNGLNYDFIEWSAAEAGHFVVAGLSYWPCDRDELDDLVNSVAETGRVSICNPNPAPDWIARINAKFGPDRVQQFDGPPSID